MTLLRRLLNAVRQDRLRRAVGFRLRQFAYANSHPGDHYLRLGDEHRPFTFRRALRIPQRIAEQPVAFSIDVVSVCNLACPTCPVANWPKASWTDVKGVMDPMLLHQLIRKAMSECLVGDISLFAYTEPLLHPHLPELVRMVKSYGLACRLSTNLNVMRDADALLRAEPDEIRISVSGFHQDSYGVTHAGGDIEVVKQHVRALAEARQRLSSNTVITVYFHKYRSNLDDLPLMKAFATSLGLGFDDCWASFFPLEKVLTDANPELALAEVTAADLDTIDRLGAYRSPTSSSARRSRRLTRARCTIARSSSTSPVMSTCVVKRRWTRPATRSRPISTHRSTSCRRARRTTASARRAWRPECRRPPDAYFFGLLIGGTMPFTR